MKRNKQASSPRQRENVPMPSTFSASRVHVLPLATSSVIHWAASWQFSSVASTTPVFQLMHDLENAIRLNLQREDTCRYHGDPLLKMPMLHPYSELVNDSPLMLLEG